MALEAVVVQQEPFAYNPKDLYSLFGSSWGSEVGLADQKDQQQNGSLVNFLENQTENFHLMAPYLDQYWGPNSSSDPDTTGTVAPEEFSYLDASTTVSERPKRRRSRSKKNKEEIENQRMTHIAVERNRRKQMNEYLSVLRGLMPDSYVQRSDQASIIGGAINYVKELEQRLQFLGGQKFEGRSFSSSSSSSSSSSPFAEFFTFPQYSTSSPSCCDNSVVAIAGGPQSGAETLNGSGIADIEVTMMESHANLKIRSKRRPKQLLKVVSGLQSLRLTILHLNVTTVDQIVLYSLSVKVEDDCRLSSVDEIASAVNQLLVRIHHEVLF